MKTYKRISVLSLVLLLLLNAFGGFSLAAQATETYVVTSNPYQNVDWETYGQYKADFHAHSTNSDGSHLTAQMVEDHYAKGFDILAMTDHDYTTFSWNTVDKGALSFSRVVQMETGVGRDGKNMIGVFPANEQSSVDHINSFWASYNNTGTGGLTAVEKMSETIGTVEKSGGITHLNHPGRYTGGGMGYAPNDEAGIAAANNEASVSKYVNLFMTYPSCVGMEIINKIDGDSRSDRVLWDNILTKTMPEGRSVWGFSNDDAHSMNAIGYSWNVMLMPALNTKETRIAMEDGAFYAVSRVSRLDGINRYYPNNNEMRGDGDASTLYLLDQSTPGISNIVVSESTITITGADYDVIEWIADGKVIATGATIDLNDHKGEINSYVRAQLKSSTGIAFTQPFGVESHVTNGENNENKKVVTPSAFVEKLNGNKNNLTITVTETNSDGTTDNITKTFSIDNNAAGTYVVGLYKVYVDTKGNTQIRACYIVE